ncbi:MAG TPA: DNA translocase FtsK 4TM domain-containing protein [Candidatus Limnocylindrales bacterium]|nr:DNA translocase FtsK 4TM domain-containing protein [Candidatus Limnocylindrales bacterium]
MATRRRPRRQARRRRSGLASFRLPDVGKDVARSLVGITLLVLGAVTLIAFLPGEGSLTTWFRDTVAPWFGTLRWALPFVLLAAGWYLEWGPGKTPGSGWGLTLVGVVVAYLGLLGAASVLVPPSDRGAGGGRVGTFMEEGLSDLVTPPGAFVLLIALGIAGVLVAFNLRLSQLTSPLTSTARRVGGVAADSMRRELPPADPRERPARGANGSNGASPEQGSVRGGARARGVRPVAGSGDVAGQTGIWGEDRPPGTSAPAPTSATFAPPRSPSATAVEERPGLPPDLNAATAAALARRAEAEAAEEPDAPWRPNRYTAPGRELLDDTPEPVAMGGEEAAHRWTEEQIVKKLKSFDIEAKIVGRNAGPVVTQYEVQPAPHVKVSRIEGLADDLAMALAARSLRIEAPIPGKAAVGIEIPNRDFNVVSLRGILESVDFAASGSKLTFALGRDVAGRAQAVDLAKMPHLLIAGATGSGKSVMVNALITSLLCNATPDDVRMILIDLKRIELAAYNGLPHLKERILTEPHEAKSALKWAVREMEDRYKTFAAATARNIRAYNENRDPTTAPMPYIVIVIDELADLMMREGKHVEDSIVRLAQKARATGIHMVLATQRPSVNVVTGLIKANFPSRIGFAMASQIDSRTILDAPGAEDLIGRGDMLYQPSDLPRPMRLQGVFVTDAEIGRIVQSWKDQANNETDYDDEVLAFSEPGEDGSAGGSQFGWLREMGVDDATLQAAELITATGKASTSYLQTKLRLGFARAARVMDELERYGIVSPQDPQRPAAPRHVYGPDNWITSRNGNALDD